MTFCMNVSRFMNLAAIFSLDLESQFIAKKKYQKLSVGGRILQVCGFEQLATKSAIILN